jgi:hypothetical protein
MCELLFLDEVQSSVYHLINTLPIATGHSKHVSNNVYVVPCTDMLASVSRSRAIDRSADIVKNTTLSPAMVR